MAAHEQDEGKRNPGEGEQPLSGGTAQEQHLEDDQQRVQQQDPGEHANPNQPPRPSDERVGPEGQEQGTEPPRGEDRSGDYRQDEQVERQEQRDRQLEDAQEAQAGEITEPEARFPADEDDEPDEEMELDGSAGQRTAV